MEHKTTYTPFGDAAILIAWEAEISISISEDILEFQSKIEGIKDDNIVAVIIGYSSLTIVFKNKYFNYLS